MYSFGTPNSGSQRGWFSDSFAYFRDPFPLLYPGMMCPGYCILLGLVCWISLRGPLYFFSFNGNRGGIEKGKRGGKGRD